MVWINHFFFWAMSTSVTGSIMVLILLILERIPKWRDSRVFLYWIKTAEILYLIPITACMVMASRICITQSGIGYINDFGNSTSPEVTKVYQFCGCIWLMGLAIGVIYRVREYGRLRQLLKGNVPVEQKEWESVCEELKEKYGMKEILVWMNDQLNDPITVGTFRAQIILPYRKMTEKEMYMALEHEMNHIRNHDLLWKKIGLLVTFFHWWNPLTYVLLRKLNLQEEIECDICACKAGNQFTMEEYGLFLAGMKEHEDSIVFLSALCNSKESLYRRLEMMANERKTRSVKKITAIGTSLILMALSVVPAYAASEGWARMEEAWLEATEVEREVEDPHFEQYIEHGVADDSVEEIDLTSEMTTYASGSTKPLDHTIKAYTRLLYGYEQMQAGDEISITARCSDSSITYRIGIKNKATTEVDYREGSGTLMCTFSIDEAGEYSAYVENRSSVEMEVTGLAYYPE